MVDRVRFDALLLHERIAAVLHDLVGQLLPAAQ